MNYGIVIDGDLNCIGGQIINQKCVSAIGQENRIYSNVGGGIYIDYGFENTITNNKIGGIPDGYSGAGDEVGILINSGGQNIIGHY